MHLHLYSYSLNMHLINIVLVPLNSSKLNIYFNITVTNQSLFLFAFLCDIDSNMDTDKQRNQIWNRNWNLYDMQIFALHIKETETDFHLFLSAAYHENFVAAIVGFQCSYICRSHVDRTYCWMLNELRLVTFKVMTVLFSLVTYMY